MHIVSPRLAPLGSFLLLLAACSDDGRNETSAPITGVSSIASLGPTGSPTTEEPGTESASGPTSTGGSTTTPAGPTEATSVSSDSTPKFDFGNEMQPDFGGPDEGPIIPETCDQASAGKSTVGCRFYAVDMDSHDSVETSQYAIAVANVQLAASANVVVEVKNGGVWSPVGGPQAVAPLSLFTFNLPDRHIDDSGVNPGGSYRVTSDVPVVAYQFNPVDGASSFLSDAAMLYPAAALDTINRVTAWKSMYDNTNGFQHSYVTVIATVDGTMVQVEPSVVTAAGPSVPQGAPGAPFTIPLNEGDVLSVAVQSIPDSMTGTKINSNENHPVAVFAGQECALIPESTCCCDHMEEQLAGVRQWGKHFIASRMPIRSGGAPENTLWQIYASEDGTNVTIHADAGVTGIPATNFVLNANQMSEFYATGPATEPGDFEVIADKPIAVYGYMVGAEAFGSSIGDPAMVQMAPVEQYLPRYVVLVPGTWITDVAVVTRPVGAVITMDGVPISDAEFNPVGASGYEVARIACPDGVHVFDGGDSPFQVIIVGYDQHDSYAYLGGTGTGKINPNPPG
ncbi:IgGFc-binding protein [Nannocystis sp. ILAH1]|uniref:IgGFc-binding protein n=1 Tax=unclassified Nannocystis TaxID=2627009 RepID=UPI00227021ED|nr:MULTISPECIES: IgGFc-binding protein [unclassified Nannocystis]MCY0991787.1 IgGFc-binding protein [Nannocystis sp. ILAH1]MCY1067331.1 IgGFc-binding protein [Nannocystis sp. RBIL2]